MELIIESHKNALEIIEHPKFNSVFQEIKEVLTNCPVISFKDKAISVNRKGVSIGNKNLDVAQPIMNLLIQYRFKTLGWETYPLVIPSAGLRADFRKTKNEKVFQIEIQFGNMARWYSDVFKFQLASIVGKTDIGICIVPMKEFADRIDSNVAHFERCMRELPEISTLLHLPILVIGLTPTDKTPVIDLAQFGFDFLKDDGVPKEKYGQLKKKASAERIVQAIVAGSDYSKVNETTALELGVALEVEEDSAEG